MQIKETSTRIRLYRSYMKIDTYGHYHIHNYMHACTYIYICVYMYKYVNIYIYKYACTHECRCIHILYTDSTHTLHGLYT